MLGRRGGWNRKRSVGGVLVDVGILAIAEPARVVIVEQVVVTGLATRVDPKSGKVAHDRPYSGLRDIRAIAIGAAAIDRGNRIRRWITGVVALAVAVFSVPVVGPGSGVGVFDFIHRSCVGIGRSVIGLGEYLFVVRWYFGSSGAVAEPDHIGVTEHDVVGASAAVDGLMEVVAHREVIREKLEIGGIALLHVVKGERGRSFTRSRCFGNRGQIVVSEAGQCILVRGAKRRLCDAICARPNSHLNPGEQAGIAAGGLSALMRLKLQFSCCHI